MPPVRCSAMDPAEVSLKSETDSDAPEWCNSQSMSETLTHDPEEAHACWNVQVCVSWSIITTIQMAINISGSSQKILAFLPW